MTGRLVLAFLLGLTSAGGCKKLSKRVVEPQTDFLLLGYDVLTRPGETVTLRARLQRGRLLRDQEDEEIRFYLGGRLYESARTDDEGFARVDFSPQAAGDFHFAVEFRPQRDWPTGIRAELLVAVRAANTTLVVIDIDKTLAATRKRDFVGGDAKPLPGAPAAVKRIAGKYTVVYLTHRPDYLGRKSKAWLARHGFPRAPLFLSRAKQFLRGSRRFKRQAISRIRKGFTGPAIGIGDKASDMEAYLANGLKAIMILPVDEGSDADDLRDHAKELDKVDESVQVAAGWREVEKILFEGASFSRAAVQAKLRARARAMDER